MAMFKIVLVAVLLACSRSIPDGFILKVSHHCGNLVSGGGVAAENASVTIVSDLHVMGHLKCRGTTDDQKIDVGMDSIDKTHTQSTSSIYYPGDNNGQAGTSCFFFTPQNSSNVYVAELMVFWGFNNGTVMDNYQTYTITCTADGHGHNTIAAKTIDDGIIPVTNDLHSNLGTPYSHTGTLKLIDILGNEITSKYLPVGKKVQLELSINGSGGGGGDGGGGGGGGGRRRGGGGGGGGRGGGWRGGGGWGGGGGRGGSEPGLTPYECEASNSAGTKTYRLLNAGCGDGYLFPKDVGFETFGTKAVSPMFKAFKLIEALGSNAQVSYKCTFATCSKACDGSSCALRQVSQPLSRKERRKLIRKRIRQRIKKWLKKMLKKRRQMRKEMKNNKKKKKLG